MDGKRMVMGVVAKPVMAYFAGGKYEVPAGVVVMKASDNEPCWAVKAKADVVKIAGPGSEHDAEHRFMWVPSSAVEWSEGPY